MGIARRVLASSVLATCALAPVVSAEAATAVTRRGVVTSIDRAAHRFAIARRTPDGAQRFGYRVVRDTRFAFACPDGLKPATFGDLAVRQHVAVTSSSASPHIARRVLIHRESC